MFFLKLGNRNLCPFSRPTIGRTWVITRGLQGLLHFLPIQLPFDDEPRSFKHIELLPGRLVNKTRHREIHVFLKSNNRLAGIRT